MASQHYSVREIQTRTGVNERTLRHWIQKRLLSPPRGHGRAAYYTESQLLRVRAIQRLRESRLPLHAIRSRLAGLNDEQLRALLPPPSRKLSPEAPPPPPPLPKYPAVPWESVTLVEGLILMVRADVPALRRLAGDIYSHYGPTSSV